MSFTVDGNKWCSYDTGWPILFPKRIASNWHGAFLPTDDGDSADLKLPSGNFKAERTFDFTNPKTDYDRICARVNEPHFVVDVEGGTGITFATEGDWVTWWAEEKILVNDGFTYGNLPEKEDLKTLAWKDSVEWEVRDTDFIMFPSANHGGDPDLDPDDCFEIKLEPGKYKIEYAVYEKNHQLLFRLTKT